MKRHTPDLFFASEVSRILDIPRRKVLLYVEQGVVKPTNPSQGRGVHRQFDLNDLLELLIVAKLERLGLIPRHMRAVISVVRSLRIFQGRTANPEAWAAGLLGERGEAPPFLVARAGTGDARYSFSLHVLKGETFALSRHLGDVPEDTQRYAQYLLLDVLCEGISITFSLEVLVRDLQERLERFLKQRE